MVASGVGPGGPGGVGGFGGFGGPGGFQGNIRVEDLGDLGGIFGNLFGGGGRGRRGSVVRDKCKNCKGRGIEVRPRTVKVRIPAGVDDGQRIRVKGRGTPGINGGPAGDLYVVVHVAPHPIFARSGKWDLTVKVPISFPEAALGAQVKVPTLDGPVTVKVPPGTQTGKTVRVRGRGIPRQSGDPGALLVTFDVVVPHELDENSRAAVEQLAASLPGNPREHLGV